MYVNLYRDRKPAEKEEEQTKSMPGERLCCAIYDPGEWGNGLNVGEFSVLVELGARITAAHNLAELIRKDSWAMCYVRRSNPFFEFKTLYFDNAFERESPLDRLEKKSIEHEFIFTLWERYRSEEELREVMNYRWGGRA